MAAIPVDVEVDEPGRDERTRHRVFSGRVGLHGRDRRAVEDEPTRDDLLVEDEATGERRGHRPVAATTPAGPAAPAA